MRRLLIAGCVCVLMPTGAALAAVTGTFDGRTSAGGKVVLKIVGGTVKPGSFIRFKARCTTGVFLEGTTVLGGPLHPGNRFSVVNAHTTNSVNGGKLIAHHAITVRFKVTGWTATGTYSNGARIVTRSGKPITRCDTGRLTFSAHR